MSQIEIIKISGKCVSNMDQNNYIIMRDNQCILIDASADVIDIKNTILDKELIGVILTHSHFDHIAKLNDIVSEFNCPIYMSENASKNIFNERVNLGKYFGLPINIDKNINIKILQSGQTKIGEFEITTYITKGHTDCGICVKIGDNLFTGDTLFAESYGNYQFRTGDKFELANSLRQIKDIDYNTLFAGHGASISKQDINKYIDFFIEQLEN